MKIYVVLSEAWDVTSVANRAFKDFDAAYQYKLESEDKLGGRFRIILVELEG